MKLTAIQNDRAAGVLLATAAGDALGAGYEFTYPAADVAIGMIGGGLGFAPGEWTDDTSMAIGIAQVTAAGLDLRTAAGLDAVAANWSRWYRSSPTDIGNQTRAVLSRRDGTAAAMTRTASRVPGLKGGNGSLMRTAPVALAYLGDPGAAVDAARQVSQLTHDDLQAAQACEMWTYAIHHAVLDGNFDGVRDYLDAHLETAAYWNPLLDRAETGSPEDFPKNGWVVDALLTAWWAIHQSPADGPLHLQRSLEFCVRAGHDTDTTAAIAGGLLGARWGASAVPARWRRVLHGYPGLRARDLVSLAIRAARGGQDDATGWPSVPHLDYAHLARGKVTEHPHDPGVLVGDAGAVPKVGPDAVQNVDAVVSLCRMGSEVLPVEHVEFWLVDAGSAENANLQFVIDDAARTVRDLRDEGKRVLLHCAEGMSRTPSIAARYSMLLGKNPEDVRGITYALDGATTQVRPNQELWAAALHG